MIIDSERSALTLLFCVCYGTLLAQVSTGDTGARSMFHNPWTGTVVAPATSAPPKQNEPSMQRTEKSEPRFVGVQYWLYLEGVGRVTESREFMTGERIRVHVRANVDGYLAVWTAATDGSAQLLVPANGDVSGSRVLASRDYESPPLRFRPPVREEQLYLAFARMKSAMPSFATVSRDIASFDPSGGRDIVTEVDQTTVGEIGTYVVNARGGPIARHIKIRHVSP